jgi:hypothetical protein
MLHSTGTFQGGTMTISTTENLLLEKLQKLDKQIEETDRALLHLNKQYGAKMSKYTDLKKERNQISEALKELRSQELVPVEFDETFKKRFKDILA